MASKWNWGHSEGIRDHREMIVRDDVRTGCSDGRLRKKARDKTLAFTTYLTMEKLLQARVRREQARTHAPRFKL